MGRRRLAMVVLAVTAGAVWAMLAFGGREEAAVDARLVTVTRGDVQNVAALTGRVAFLDETLAYAAAPGLVEAVYVTEGERVAAGQALVRLDASAYERAATAWIASGETLHETGLTAADAQSLLASTVVRAPVNGNVRQILTHESAAVAAGTPVVLLSSTEQAVVCIVAEADARSVRAGMEALLSVDGEAVGRAEVAQVGDITADALTGRMVCDITLHPEQRLDLPAGAAVDADVFISGRDDVPVLPVEAVTERGTVWWVSEGRCTEIPAKIVLSDEMNVWVALPEGLTVAVGEFEEGQRVREVQP